MVGRKVLGVPGAYRFEHLLVSIPGSTHIRTLEIDPGGPTTTYEGGGSGGVVRNGPRGPPTQRTPRSRRPVDPRGSLNG